MSPLSSVSRQDHRSPRTRPRAKEPWRKKDQRAEFREQGMKRRGKNRDAARKSRKKQTQIADELHEEMQLLERTNSALLKEVEQLQKDAQVYETMLKNHEPLCRLHVSGSADLHSPAPPCSSHKDQTPEGSATPLATPSSSHDAPCLVLEKYVLPPDLVELADYPLVDFSECYPVDYTQLLDSEGGSYPTVRSRPLSPVETNDASSSLLSTLFSSEVWSSNPSPPWSLPSHPCTQQSLIMPDQPSNDRFPFDPFPPSEYPAINSSFFNPGPSTCIHSSQAVALQPNTSETPAQNFQQSEVDRFYFSSF